eukprot:TRINITY_DN6263_c0_g1_i3.p1 TRINITY_DN6263_c0_g1~~TRINITY_DN6263_c0_g1_i3.p1  ORF type:complete len:692 (-),score=139.16 TRINITY_DN6263_c0_g1_i3:78-2153(-)
MLTLGRNSAAIRNRTLGPKEPLLLPRSNEGIRFVSSQRSQSDISPESSLRREAERILIGRRNTLLNQHSRRSVPFLRRFSEEKKPEEEENQEAEKPEKTAPKVEYPKISPFLKDPSKPLGLNGPFKGVHALGTDWWENWYKTKDVPTPKKEESYFRDQKHARETIHDMKKLRNNRICNSFSNILFELVSTRAWNDAIIDMHERIPRIQIAEMQKYGVSVPRHRYVREFFAGVMDSGWCNIAILIAQLIMLSIAAWFAYVHLQVMELFPGVAQNMILPRCGERETPRDQYFHRYRDEHVLKETLFHLAEGTLLVLVGPPQSGKSSLLQECLDSKLFLTCRVDASKDLIAQFTRNSPRRHVMRALHGVVEAATGKSSSDVEYLENILQSKLEKWLFIDYFNLLFGTLSGSRKVFAPRTRVIYIENADSLTEKMLNQNGEAEVVAFLTMLTRLPNVSVVLDSNRGAIDFAVRRANLQSKVLYKCVGDLQDVAARQFVRQQNPWDWINTKMNNQAMEVLGGRIPDLLRFGASPTNPATFGDIFDDLQDFLLSKIPVGPQTKDKDYTLQEFREVVKTLLAANEREYASVREYEEKKDAPKEAVGVDFKGVPFNDLKVSTKAINSMLEHGLIYFDPSTLTIKFASPKALYFFRAFPEQWLTGVGRRKPRPPPPPPPPKTIFEEEERGYQIGVNYIYQ